MWNPANNLKWQKDALCAQPENEDSVDWFFSPDFSEKYKAKNLCHSCPVRRDCLQWALEHRQIWGIWGGRDEIDIRRTLSVSYNGEEIRRRRFPNCPYCTARPSKLETTVVNVPGGGRWTTAKVVYCTECGFSWKSRTSANAVQAYKADREERLAKSARIKKEEINPPKIRQRKSQH